MPWRHFASLSPRRRLTIGVIVTLLVLFALTHLAGYLVLSHLRGQTDAAIDGQCKSYLETASHEFGALQQSVRDAAEDVARLEVVAATLSGADSLRSTLFAALAHQADEHGLGIEVYDRRGTLLAWGGQGGTAHRREVLIALDGKMFSSVSHELMAWQLFLATPVRTPNGIVGVVLVRRTIENDVPLSNRYLHRESLARDLTSKLGVNVELNFSPAPELRKDSAYVSEVLYGIDSVRVGTVSVLRPENAVVFDAVAQPFQIASTLLLFAALALSVVVLLPLVTQTRFSLFVRFAGATGVIWLVRYALHWIDVVSILPPLALFDPALFASPFGGGIARSIGEMTISVVALVLTVGYGVMLFFEREHEHARLPRTTWLQRFPWRLLAAVIVVLLLFWLQRGYGALIRSVVFDSTLRLGDPREIVPSFELAVMIIDLILVGACLLAIAAIAVWRVVVLVAGTPSPRPAAWIWTMILLVSLGWVFGEIQESPLMPAWYRAMFAVFSFLLTVLVAGRRKTGRSFSMLAPAVLAVMFSAFLLYPLNDLNVREKDRDQVESFGAEVVRPIDGWLSFIVEDGVKHLTSDEVLTALEAGDPEEIGRVAFLQWTQSVACREGYTSLFAVTDTLGKVLSRFVIGGQSNAALDLDSTLRLPAQGGVVARVFGSTTRVYMGAAPIRSAEGVVEGYGVVEVVRGRKTLFRGENPDLLRNVETEDINSFYRPLTVSEFSGNAVVNTSNAAVPIGYQVPEKAVKALSHDGGTGSVWVNETIDGEAYETLYLHRPQETNDIVALAMRVPGAAWYLVGIVKILGICFLLMVLFAGGILAGRKLRGHVLLPTFRDRLLGAFLVTSFIPLLLISVYGQYAARQRMMDNAASILNDYTFAIAQIVPDSLFQHPPGHWAPEAEQMASDIGTDFNLYADGQLFLSSRPELFEAGVMARRLDGMAYARIFLEGKRFFVNTERIGLYQYAVGYRPIFSDEGSILAVVSVPMLFRQDEVDTEQVQRNAFLIAVYLILIGVVLVIATTFAARISAPIRRLTQATGRVAAGDYDIALGDVRADGEIGGLIRSFEHMAGEIRRKREELVAAERQLAWKEMAKQVAHEIKNPLTPMRLAVQHLRLVFREGGAELGTVLEEVTGTLLRQIDTLSRIASEFSHFGRLPQPVITRCDVHELLRESVALFGREGSVEQQWRLASAGPQVMADRDELRRAFMNIIRNAVQAMNNAGVLTVATATAEGSVVIRISDTGHGMSEDVKKKLFVPNFSTKTEGMGLGLAIVKKTLDDLHGTIQIESEVERGTTVIITLPGAGQEGLADGGQT